jgi:hypothetical protein
MKRRLVLYLVLALIWQVSAGPVLPAAGHTYTSYCPSNEIWPLLNIFEHRDYGGAQDYACFSDADWRDSSGYIRGFHDAMSSYHIRKTPNTLYGSCVRFYEHLWSGDYFTDKATSTLPHKQETYVGSAWNDRVDSHRVASTDSSFSCLTFV